MFLGDDYDDDVLIYGCNCWIIQLVKILYDGENCII